MSDGMLAMRSFWYPMHISFQKVSANLGIIRRFVLKWKRKNMLSNGEKVKANSENKILF